MGKGSMTMNDKHCSQYGMLHKQQLIPGQCIIFGNALVDMWLYSDCTDLIYFRCFLRLDGQYEGWEWYVRFQVLPALKVLQDSCTCTYHVWAQLYMIAARTASRNTLACCMHPDTYWNWAKHMSACLVACRARMCISEDAQDNFAQPDVELGTSWFCAFLQAVHRACKGIFERWALTQIQSTHSVSWLWTMCWSHLRSAHSSVPDCRSQHFELR